MRFIKKIALLWIFSICICLTSNGQKLSYELVKTTTKIGQDEPLLVSIIISTFDDISQPICLFPEYKFFSKLGISKSKSTKYIEGKKQINFQITQSYQPQKNGTFTLPEDFITVDGQKIKKESIDVTVSGYTEKEQSLENLEEVNEIEFANKEAFLLLSCSNKKPYIGQGFTLSLTFFVSENNTVPMRFENNEKQIPEIVKRIKPLNCWEESYSISEALEGSVILKGKKMKTFTFYKATFFPLNEKQMFLPKQTFILKTDASDPAKQKPIYFTSNPIVIRPKALPPHPLKEKVFVGQFQLKEHTSPSVFYTGKSVEYTAELLGDGNVSTIIAPVIENSKEFDFYTPTENTSITTGKDGIIGNKSFTFSIIPKQAGTFALEKYFYWIYFDPIKARYDTLRSTIQLDIKGASLVTNKNQKQSVDIYDGLEEIPTKLNEVNYTNIIQRQFNLIVFLLSLCMIYVFWKSNNNKKK